ncbi:HAD-IA family hydrolase [Candidatus Daviesbacteria bacterium]|nr:HAD-IA family hydrolase [Candidatus Daviesbacteria bacterium]
MLDKKQVILFDFDGTIANTIDIVSEIYNKFAPSYGFKTIDKKEMIHIKSLSPLQILKDLRKSWLSFIKLPFFIKKIEGELNRQMESVKFYPGIIELLKRLKSEGYKLGIISSDTKKNIKKFLKLNDLDFFDFIYTGSFWGKSNLINKFLKDLDFKPSEVIYIGDEVRDIQAANKSQIDIVSVTWGFGSKKTLFQHKPNFIVNKPMDILFFLKKFNV